MGDARRRRRLGGAGTLPLCRIVPASYSLDELAKGFRQMGAGGDVMKLLIRCSED